jgi:hypothetical protein
MGRTVAAKLLVITTALAFASAAAKAATSRDPSLPARARITSQLEAKGIRFQLTRSDSKPNLLNIRIKPKKSATRWKKGISAEKRVPRAFDAVMRGITTSPRRTPEGALEGELFGQTVRFGTKYSIRLAKQRDRGVYDRPRSPRSRLPPASAFVSTRRAH